MWFETSNLVSETKAWDKRRTFHETNQTLICVTPKLTGCVTIISLIKVNFVLKLLPRAFTMVLQSYEVINFIMEN